jgi:hypothetical protein
MVKSEYKRLLYVEKQDGENWRAVLTTQLKQYLIHGSAEKDKAPWITKE